MESARLTYPATHPTMCGFANWRCRSTAATAATLLYGQTMTRELEPGPHKLRVHNTLVWKTVKFELGAGEHARFAAVNRAGFGTYSMLGLLGAGPLYVTIRRDGWRP